VGGDAFGLQRVARDAKQSDVGRDSLSI
jgi:hypothetical protein